MIKFWIVAVFALVLSACESISPYGEAHTGGAVYHYENTVSPDGVKSCTVNGTTAKEVPGVKVKITSDCELEVEAGGSSPVGDAFEAINGLVERLPGVMP
ncbi:MAG: hypothetical protein JRJ45_00580 [Deltaproteobacteria bacterium]|nr:hypothetical protein [Deltaproteobacteria bacterium]